MATSREDKAPGGPAKHLEELIDESGEESFPASDPPAVHPEHGPVEHPPVSGDDARKQKQD